MKSLLQGVVSNFLSLTYWECHLHVLPLSNADLKKIYVRMLVKCKVTKFWEVNYKILMRILATPVVQVLLICTMFYWNVQALFLCTIIS